MKEIRWVEHVEHMREMLNATKYYEITEGKRQLGRTTLDGFCRNRVEGHGLIPSSPYFMLKQFI